MFSHSLFFTSVSLFLLIPLQWEKKSLGFLVEGTPAETTKMLRMC